MSKPDWKDAPDWAVWLAQNEDGLWWWHEQKPWPGYWRNFWASLGLVKAQALGQINPDWRETLEERA